MSVLKVSVAHTLGWFLQRVSALFIVIGMFVHFWVLHYFLDKPLSFDKVVARLTSPWWVIFDSLLLITVVYHALNGIWNILTDYNPSPSLRKFYGWGLFIVGLLTVIWGLYTLIPFTAPAA